jgi:hypothetical protein
MAWKTKTNLFLCTMSLFSKIFSVFKPTPKLSEKQMNELIDEVINKNESLFERLGDDKSPPIIGDDYPTYKQLIEEYESQNSK